MGTFFGKINHFSIFFLLTLAIMPIAAKPAESMDGNINGDSGAAGSSGFDPELDIIPNSYPALYKQLEGYFPVSRSINGDSENGIVGYENNNPGSDGAIGGSESFTRDSRNTDGGSERVNVDTGIKFAGGVEIVPHSYPWLVWLVPDGESYKFCGGIIIGPSAVATSASCVYQVTPAKLTLTAGDHNRNRNENSEQKMKVKEIKVVQKIPGDANVELALLKLTAPFKLNRKVQIAKIPDENYKRGKSIVAVGWGSSRSNDAAATVPLSLNFTVIPEDECKPRLQGEFCADAGNPEASAGCFMDVGGPAHEGNLVVGLFNTRGNTCGQGGKTTDVFVSTSMFAKDIEDFAGNSPLKCNDKNDVLFGVATNLMADICDQTKKFEETKEIQPPLINDLNNTIECAHVTWTKSGHGCFDYLCPNNDDDLECAIRGM